MQQHLPMELQLVQWCSMYARGGDWIPAKDAFEYTNMQEDVALRGTRKGDAHDTAWAYLAAFYVAHWHVAHYSRV